MTPQLANGVILRLGSSVDRKAKGKAHKTSADAHRQALTGVLMKSLPGLLRRHQTDKVKVTTVHLKFCHAVAPAVFIMVHAVWSKGLLGFEGYIVPQSRCGQVHIMVTL